NTSGISVIWVRVPNAGSNQLIMKYGDSAALPETNGNLTFLYYSDLSSDPGLIGTNSTNSFANYDATNDNISFQFRRDSSSNVDRYWTLPTQINDSEIAIDYSIRRESHTSHNQFGDDFGAVGISKASADPRTT